MRSVDWMAHGACLREDPGLFFPIAAGGASLRQVEKGRAICRCCPVRVTCLSYAVETGQHGIWGGTTDDERRAMREAVRQESHDRGAGDEGDRSRRRVPGSDQAAGQRRGHASRRLGEMGVEVRTGRQATGVDDHGIDLMASGNTSERLDARTVIWAAGVRAAPLAALGQAAGAPVDRSALRADHRPMNSPGSA